MREPRQCPATASDSGVGGRRPAHQPKLQHCGEQQIADGDAERVGREGSWRRIGEDEEKVDHVPLQLVRVREPQRGKGGGDE